MGGREGQPDNDAGVREEKRKGGHERQRRRKGEGKATQWPPLQAETVSQRSGSGDEATGSRNLKLASHFYIPDESQLIRHGI